MAGKSGKRITGRKPSSSTRTSAKTAGAFGQEGVDDTRAGTELNTDRAGGGKRAKAPQKRTRSAG